MQIHATPVVVVGSGVAGLSAAYQLAKAGYTVTILAKEFPGENNIMFPSDWAGAGLGVGGSVEGLARRVSLNTFQEMWKLSAEDANNGISRVPAEMYFDKMPADTSFWFKEFVTEFRVLEKGEYPSQYEYGITYLSMTVDPPIYLPWLTKRLRAMGVTIVHAELSSLSSALSYVPDAKAIINCSGIGSRYLTDVQDLEVFPQRGQTCVLRDTRTPPKMITRVGAEYTYVIPRPQSGIVVLGGIKEDWLLSPEPNPETREMFKQRAYRICPDLGPPEKMQFVKDIIGVRSTRNGGYRLERDDKGAIPIVHSYGYAGGGYQASMGSALEVVRLLKDLTASHAM